jgi:purine-nucleoside phosphorylase
MWEIGVRTLIATNAAGGMNRSFRPGDLMIITDHLNMTFDNPLIGPNDPELGPRFPAMRRAYTRSLVDLALRVADEQRIHVQKGIYVMTTGPMYETRAMGQVFRLLGGDAVGMSTVPEIIAATHAGMQTLAISVITDVAKEDPQQFTTHEEVLAVAERTLPIFISYLRAIIRALPV